VVVVIGVAALTAGWYVWKYFGAGPTSEEFRLYDAFLTRLASEGYLGQHSFVLEGETLQLSDPEYDSWVPTELRHDKTWPNANFVSFCGRLCAHDFVRKNLAASQLKPSPKVRTAFRILGGSESIGSGQCAIWVTRAGFDLRQRRAVLSYHERCDGYGGMILGDVYLLRENGMWKVDDLQSFIF